MPEPLKVFDLFYSRQLRFKPLPFSFFGSTKKNFLFIFEVSFSENLLQRNRCQKIGKNYKKKLNTKILGEDLISHLKD